MRLGFRRTTQGGATALHRAVHAHRTPVIEKLIDAGAAVDLYDTVCVDITRQAIAHCR